MVGKSLCVAGVVVTCVVVRGWGAGVTYSNRAAFEAALPAVQRYNFETSGGFPLAPAAISSVPDGLLQLGSSGGPASLDLYGGGGNQALTGRSSNQVDRMAPVMITPSGQQFAIGFDILDLGSPSAEGVYVTVSDPTDRPIAPILVQDNDGNPDTPRFFGVIWDTVMSGVEIHGENLLCAGPGTCPTANLVDNVTVAPEPGLFLMGIGGCLVVMRRRKSTGI